MPTDFIFVIRIWQAPPAPPGEPAPWRVLVEDPRSGQRWGFGDPSADSGQVLRALFDCLQHIAEPARANETTAHAPSHQ
ncbi:MAG: hypothetical protein HY782_06860 [Chloroflexi bacterium]|nr:hypothetical protein [Chloroflexota bacterium]